MSMDRGAYASFSGPGVNEIVKKRAASIYNITSRLL